MDPRLTEDVTRLGHQMRNIERADRIRRTVWAAAATVSGQLGPSVRATLVRLRRKHGWPCYAPSSGSDGDAAGVAISTQIVSAMR